MRRLLIGTVLLVAACSGSSSGKASGGDSGVVSAQALAYKIDCTSFTADNAGSRELFVADSGTCDLDGHSLTVYRFSNNESRDNWIKAATPNGIGRFVVIDRGVVTSDDQSIADEVKAKVGGEIRTS